MNCDVKKKRDGDAVIDDYYYNIVVIYGNDNGYDDGDYVKDNYGSIVIILMVIGWL